MFTRGLYVRKGAAGTFTGISCLLSFCGGSHVTGTVYRVTHTFLLLNKKSLLWIKMLRRFFQAENPSCKTRPLSGAYRTLPCPGGSVCYFSAIRTRMKDEPGIRTGRSGNSHTANRCTRSDTTGNRFSLQDNLAYRGRFIACGSWSSPPSRLCTHGHEFSLDGPGGSASDAGPGRSGPGEESRA